MEPAGSLSHWDWAGLLAAAGVLATAVSGATVGLMKGWDAVKERRDKAASAKQEQKYGEQETLLGRYAAQLDRQDRHMEEQARAIAALSAAHLECREESADLYGWNRTFHGIARQLADEIFAINKKVILIPDLPPRRHATMDSAQNEFLNRTLTHNDQLVTGLSPAHDAGTPPPPTRGAP